MKKFLAVMLGIGLMTISVLGYAGEWTGKLVKVGDKVTFMSAGKTYTVTNPSKVAGFEGQKVTLAGTADEAVKTVTVSSVTPGAKKAS